MSTSRLSLAAGLLAGLALAPTAQARVFDASGIAARLADAEACAVEIRIQGVEDDLVNGSENLQFDGMSVGAFGDIEPAITGISRGDTVLFASAAFGTATGFSGYDVMIADEDCAALEAGTEILFQGSFGEEALAFTLPSDFGASTAYDGSTLYDLETQGLSLAGIAAQVIIGNEESLVEAIDATCGCAQGGLSPLWLGLVGLVAFRRRQD